MTEEQLKNGIEYNAKEKRIIFPIGVPIVQESLPDRLDMKTLYVALDCNPQGLVYRKRFRDDTFLRQSKILLLDTDTELERTLNEESEQTHKLSAEELFKDNFAVAGSDYVSLYHLQKPLESSHYEFSPLNLKQALEWVQIYRERNSSNRTDIGVVHLPTGTPLSTDNLWKTSDLEIGLEKNNYTVTIRDCIIYTGTNRVAWTDSGEQVLNIPNFYNLTRKWK